jgi:DNA-binding transcriptional LysR family regulator
MVVFARVVEEGSFSKAARALGYSRAAISKQIAGLERDMGATLLNRTTRKMSLTEIGSEFYARCARIALEVAEAERMVAAMRGSPAGILRVACPVDFGRTHLGPLIPDFFKRYPAVRLQLVVSDSHTDIVRERCDLAIRVSAPPLESSFVGQRLATVSSYVCASPDYLAKRGVPETVEELGHHSCLIYTNRATPDIWRFKGDRTARVSGPLSADNGSILAQATLRGLGVCRLPSFLVQRHIESGELVPILRKFESEPYQVSAIYPRSQIQSPNLVAFVDYLAAKLAEQPDLER